VGRRGRRDQRPEELAAAGADATIHVFWRCRQEQPWDEPEAGCLVQRRGGLLQAVQRGLGVPRLDLDRGEPRVLAEVLGP